MKHTLSRRSFIKYVGGLMVAAFLPPKELWPEHHHLPTRPRLAPTDVEIREGRVLAAGVAVYEEAEPGAERVGYYRRDEVFRILGEVRAPGLNSYNDLWYEIEEGYVHSGWVQPMKKYPPQQPHYDVGEWGFWGEICQPSTQARLSPHPQAAVKYRFYYGTTYHIVGIQQDDEGNAWYQVFDELPPGAYQWVPAQDVRRVPREEICPLSPFVNDKKIEVDLAQQLITCFEEGEPVFGTKCASGASFTMEDDTVADFGTPTGEQFVLLKQASRHMVGEDEESPDYFDLPGVPWDTFFNREGQAIHGTYWHNDFGIPRSHGCLNVSTDAARWIYRWTHPIGGYEDDYIQSDWRVGTPITIFR